MAPTKKTKVVKPPKGAAQVPIDTGDTVVRRLTESKKIYSDLFKLEVAICKKHVGWKAERSPLHYEDAEHVHFFHTFKSNGQMNTFSNDVAGHYHRVTVVMEPVDPKDWMDVDPEDPMKGKIIREGAPQRPARDAEGHLKVKISRPLHKVKVGRGVNQKMVDKPIVLYKEYVTTNEEEGDGEEKEIFDNHVHEARYVRSDLLEKTNLSPAALIAASNIQATDGQMVKQTGTGLKKVEPTMPAGAVE